MDVIAFSVVTGEGTVFAQKVEYVNLPTGFGSLGILAGHAPMLCAVEAGIIRCRWSEGSARIRIESGIASIENNELTVLSSSAEQLRE